MNILQTQVIKKLEQDYAAFVTNIIVAGKSGTGDIIACISGAYYMFEIKLGNDRLSDLQRDKINKVINAGGQAFVITDLSQIDDIFMGYLKPILYPLNKIFSL